MTGRTGGQPAHQEHRSPAASELDDLAHGLRGRRDLVVEHQGPVGGVVGEPRVAVPEAPSVGLQVRRAQELGGVAASRQRPVGGDARRLGPQVGAATEDLVVDGEVVSRRTLPQHEAEPADCVVHVANRARPPRWHAGTPGLREGGAPGLRAPCVVAGPLRRLGVRVVEAVPNLLVHASREALEDLRERRPNAGELRSVGLPAARTALVGDDVGTGHVGSGGDDRIGVDVVVEAQRLTLGHRDQRGGGRGVDGEAAVELEASAKPLLSRPSLDGRHETLGEQVAPRLPVVGAHAVDVDAFEGEQLPGIGPGLGLLVGAGESGQQRGEVVSASVLPLVEEVTGPLRGELHLEGVLEQRLQSRAVLGDRCPNRGRHHGRVPVVDERARPASREVVDRVVDADERERATERRVVHHLVGIDDPRAVVAPGSVVDRPISRVRGEVHHRVGVQQPGALGALDRAPVGQHSDCRLACVGCDALGERVRASQRLLEDEAGAGGGVGDHVALRGVRVCHWRDAEAGADALHGGEGRLRSGGGCGEADAVGVPAHAHLGDGDGLCRGARADHGSVARREPVGEGEVDLVVSRGDGTRGVLGEGQRRALDALDLDGLRTGPGADDDALADVELRQVLVVVRGFARGLRADEEPVVTRLQGSERHAASPRPVADLGDRRDLCKRPGSDGDTVAGTERSGRRGQDLRVAGFGRCAQGGGRGHLRGCRHASVVGCSRRKHGEPGDVALAARGRVQTPTRRHADGVGAPAGHGGVDEEVEVRRVLIDVALPVQPEVRAPSRGGQALTSLISCTRIGERGDLCATCAGGLHLSHLR